MPHPRRWLQIIAGLSCFWLLAFLNLGSSRTQVAHRASTTAATVPDARLLLRRACEYLWRRQAADGGWHSAHYGLLRSGQAYTPFILHALLDVSPEVSPHPSTGIARALTFLRRKTSTKGILGVADSDLLEYPNYATAYALRCLVRVGSVRDTDLIARMRAYLIREQYRPESGFDAGSPACGGWGFGGERSIAAPGHMDLAHTRRVLQALREAGVNEQAVFQRAQDFLRLVQRHPEEQRPQPLPSGRNTELNLAMPYDGGFYFSPVLAGLNKGPVAPATRSSAAHLRSYATATCDGVLSLLAAGVPSRDERIRAARGWLARHPSLLYPQGVPRDQPAPWSEAIHFYHLAVRAEAYAALDWPGKWRGQIVSLLARHQRLDGSFVNRESHLMKEDDPLLCTALAVIALTNARRFSRSR